MNCPVPWRGRICTKGPDLPQYSWAAFLWFSSLHLLTLRTFGGHGLGLFWVGGGSLASTVSMGEGSINSWLGFLDPNQVKLPSLIRFWKLLSAHPGLQDTLGITTDDLLRTQIPANLFPIDAAFVQL